jgi:hypothetical protein
LTADPLEFLESVVRPNIKDFSEHFGDLRRCFNAIAAVDTLAAHIYEWCKKNAPSDVAGDKDDSSFRDRLAQSNRSFRILRDIAKAQKHVSLKRGEPIIDHAREVRSKRRPYGTGAYGTGRYSGSAQVSVDVDGKRVFVADVIEEALEVLPAQMRQVRAQPSAGLSRFELKAKGGKR